MRPRHPATVETWAGLNSIAHILLLHIKSEPGDLPGLAVPTCECQSRDDPLQAGHSTHKSAKKPNLGADSIGGLWTQLCDVLAPACLHRELGAVMGSGRLNHRTHKTRPM